MNKLIAVVLLLNLSACAVTKIPQATGGSKSDGIVELSYQYGGFEKPKVEWGQALTSAKQRCKAWGYGDAEPFGGTTSTCQARNGYGCTAFFVTAKYQCLD